MPRPYRSVRLGALAAVAVLPVLLTACTSTKSGSDNAGSSGGKVKIGLITKTETNPFFVKMKEGAEGGRKAEGAELMTAAGKFDGDNASQVTAIENMIAAGVKGILITPSDSKAIVPRHRRRPRAQGIIVDRAGHARPSRRTPPTRCSPPTTSRPAS